MEYFIESLNDVETYLPLYSGSLGDLARSAKRQDYRCPFSARKYAPVAYLSADLGEGCWSASLIQWRSSQRRRNKLAQVTDGDSNRAGGTSRKSIADL